MNKTLNYEDRWKIILQTQLKYNIINLYIYVMQLYVMAEIYPYGVDLTQGQIIKVTKAVVNNFGLNLRLKKEQLSDG